MTHGGGSLGSAISLKACDRKNPAQFFEVKGGVIFPRNLSGYCFNVLGGSDSEGQPLGLWDTCTVDQPNSFFYLSGQVKGSGQCIDSLGDDSYAGKSLATYPCDASRRGQIWDYYWY
jgi:hypothetical protein